MIRTTPLEFELEGDEKHADTLEEDWCMANCNPVATPYVKPTGSFNRPVGADEAKAMSLADSTLYRWAAARSNYVALDRPDLNVASRVASSHMSNPK